MCLSWPDIPVAGLADYRKICRLSQDHLPGARTSLPAFQRVTWFSANTFDRHVVLEELSPRAPQTTSGLRTEEILRSGLLLDMGSIEQQPLVADREDAGRDAVTVLVTGFGPFQERYPVNPSYEIARSLPSSLPRSKDGDREVDIIGYGSPIRVCYAEARELIPALLQAYSDTVDLVLHIGMASGRQHYTAERYGHRDGYVKNKDLDGNVPPYDEPDRVYGDCPNVMTTSLKFDEVLHRWRDIIASSPKASPAHGADCRLSEDAGYFLCDYTYFSSLAWYGRRNKKMEGGLSTDRPVLFLHVPADSDTQTLEKGRLVAVALIRAMVESWSQRRTPMSGAS